VGVEDEESQLAGLRGKFGIYAGSELTSMSEKR